MRRINRTSARASRPGGGWSKGDDGGWSETSPTDVSRPAAEPLEGPCLRCGKLSTPSPAKYGAYWCGCG